MRGSGPVESQFFEERYFVEKMGFSACHIYIKIKGNPKDESAVPCIQSHKRAFSLCDGQLTLQDDVGRKMSFKCLPLLIVQIKSRIERGIFFLLNGENQSTN